MNGVFITEFKNNLLINWDGYLARILVIYCGESFLNCLAFEYLR